MLHLQLRVPVALTDQVVELLCDDETVTNVAVFEGGYAKPPGTLVVADVAREGANPVVAALRALGLHHEGSIMISEPATLLSDAAHDAERAAPGIPDDGIVWDVVENRVRKESVLSFAFLAFLTLATLIAGAGRLLDQPILIIGAMVVGPEFSPVAAICVAAGPAASRDPAAGAHHALRRLRARGARVGAVLAGRARLGLADPGGRRERLRTRTSSCSRTSGRSSSRCWPASPGSWR